jgi:hypothetical protein
VEAVRLEQKAQGLEEVRLIVGYEDSGSHDGADHSAIASQTGCHEGTNRIQRRSGLPRQAGRAIPVTHRPLSHSTEELVGWPS